MIVGQIFDLPIVLFDGHMYDKNFLIKFNDERQMEQPTPWTYRSTYPGGDIGCADN
jgi:hypothetical protein